MCIPVPHCSEHNAHAPPLCHTPYIQENSKSLCVCVCTRRTNTTLAWTVAHKLTMVMSLLRTTRHKQSTWSSKELTAADSAVPHRQPAAVQSCFSLASIQFATAPPLSEVEGLTRFIHRTPQDPLLGVGPNSAVCCQSLDSHLLPGREDQHNGVGVVQGGVTWHGKEENCNIIQANERTTCLNQPVWI